MFIAHITSAIILAAASLNLAAPLYQITIGETSSAAPLSIERRDSNWGWDEPQDVVGTYPDGTKKCRIFSPTNGNIEQPCPPILSQKQYAKLLKLELCNRPGRCCTSDADPIPCKILATMQDGWYLQ